MSKPSIFFSHSSKDANALKLLQDEFIKKTGSAIDIFMSSDGSSIPFGRNWVKEVEDGLNNAKLMFVFITPNSLGSNWLFFESGYAYSRGIKVTPIGMFGVDLDTISPPLNLLQGFNITSKEGLNNILSIINDEFSFSFPLNFETSLFQSIELTAVEKDRTYILNRNHLLSKIDHIRIPLPNRFSHEGNTINIKPNYFHEIPSLLKSNHIIHTIGKNKIISHGFSIANELGNQEKLNPCIYVDPMSLNHSYPIIKKILLVAYNNCKQYSYEIHFSPNYSLLDIDYKITSRLMGTKAEIDEELPLTIFKYKNIHFRILQKPFRSPKIRPTYGEFNRKPYLVVIFDINNIDEIPLEELLGLLYENQVLTG